MAEKLEEIVKQPELKPKQWAFVREYLVDFNAGAAAERAGYKYESAYHGGHALMRNRDILWAIEIEKNKMATNQDVKRQKLISILSTICEDEQEKTADRIAAIKLLGQYYGGMFSEKVELDNRITITIDQGIKEIGS